MTVEQNHWFRIDEDGNWFHNDGPITRAALAKLFADKGLKVDEDGNYWMQSPFEKYPVEVEDVPFVVVDYREEAGAIKFVTNMDENIEVSNDHPIELRFNEKQDMKLPYIHVRGGLYARLGRSVYHELAEKYGPVLKVGGQEYPLGEIDG